MHNEVKNPHCLSILSLTPETDHNNISRIQPANKEPYVHILRHSERHFHLDLLNHVASRLAGPCIGLNRPVRHQMAIDRHNLAQESQKFVVNFSKALR